MLLLIYSKFLTSVLQEAYDLMSGGDAGIDVGFGSLSAHFLRSEEYAVAILSYKFIGIVRLNIGNIANVGTSF